jgi:hypothetical protein
MNIKMPKVNRAVEAFDQLIDDQAVNVKVYRTVPCPNVKSIDGVEHEINCPLCNGSQFVDRKPIVTKALIQAVESKTDHLIEGLYDGNTVRITFPREIDVQYYTMVELADFTESYSQRIARQRGKVDLLKYRGKKVHLLVDSHGKEYFQGSDFKLDVNGNIAWGLNKGPSVDTIYSINYETEVKYRIVRSIHSNRFASITDTENKDKMVKLPEQWLASKIFLVDRKDQYGEIMPENQLPTHEITED